MFVDRLSTLLQFASATRSVDLNKPNNSLDVALFSISLYHAHPTLDTQSSDSFYLVGHQLPKKMADSLTLKMRGLAVSSSQHLPSSSNGHHGSMVASKMDRPAPPTSMSTSSSAALPRIAPVITKYRNPDLGKHEGQASSNSSTNHNQDAPRAALMRLAGGAPNFDRTAAAGPSNLSKITSPKRLAGQHPAHGIHGPAHGTTGRTLASKIVPAEAKKVPLNPIQTAVIRDHTLEKRAPELALDVRATMVKEPTRKSDLEPLDLPFKP